MKTVKKKILETYFLKNQNFVIIWKIIKIQLFPKIYSAADKKQIDIKENMPWKYQDTLCVACEMCESDETMDHFM